MARKQAKEKHTPLQEFQFGSVKASIWANGPEHGSKHHVTFRRLYKEGEEVNEAAGFRMLDLPVLAFAADEAFWWLRERTQAEKAAQGQPYSVVVRPNPEMVALFRRSARPEVNRHP